MIRSERPRATLIHVLLLLFSCLPPEPGPYDTGPSDSGSDTGTDTLDPGELVSTHGSEHCDAVTEDQVWASDANPHSLDCIVHVDGAVLVLGPGTVVIAAPGSGLVVAESGAGRLQIVGSEADPVSVGADPPGDRGTWQGVFLGPNTDGPAHQLVHLTVDGAGASDGVHRPAALFVEAPDTLVEQVSLTASEGYGFALAGEGSFDPASDGLHVTTSDASAFAEVWATGTIPDGDLTGNDADVIDLPGGQLTTSARWDAKDVAYRLLNDAYVDGTGDDPAVLTLGAGTTLTFQDNRGLYIGTSGPAALTAVGTEDAPVVFRGYRKQAGSWAGVGIRAQDTGSVLTDFELAYGGASFPLDGQLHLEDAKATVDRGYVHDSESCGVWLEGGTSDVGPDMTWESNADGDLCQP